MVLNGRKLFVIMLTITGAVWNVRVRGESVTNVKMSRDERVREKRSQLESSKSEFVEEKATR